MTKDEHGQVGADVLNQVVRPAKRDSKMDTHIYR